MKLENYQMPMQYQNVLLRLVAYLLDMVMLLALLNFTGTKFGGINPFKAANEGYEFLDAALNNYASFLIWLVYCTFMEASKYQGSFGKYLLKIKVVDYEGSKISLKKAALRNILKILSLFPVGLGYLWAFFDVKKRTWHDSLTKCVVVKRLDNQVLQHNSKEKTNPENGSA